MVTQLRLKQLLYYCPRTGVFTWKHSTKLRLQANSVAGVPYTDKSGKSYLQIYIDGRKYLAHRLAWIYVNKHIGSLEIDHKDGNGKNNAIDNLRYVTGAENKKNKRLYKNNRSGVPGVIWRPEINKWRAIIHSAGKQISLGYYQNFEDAVEARKKAEATYKFHANHGNSRPL